MKIRRSDVLVGRDEKKEEKRETKMEDGRRVCC